MKQVIIPISGTNTTSYSKSVIPRANNIIKKEGYTRVVCKGINHKKTQENGNKLTFFVEFDTYQGVEAFI